MEKPENRTSSQISSGQLSLADLMPESVKRVFKASKKHNQVYLEGIDTLVNDNDLEYLNYKKSEDEGKNLAYVYWRDFKNASKIMNPKNEGEKMETSQLKKRMATVNAIVTDKDLARLTNTPNIITSENYLELCKEYEADMEGHDPLVGAYKLLEDSNGNIDFNIVNDIFEAFGHETLKKKDIEILHEFLDVDRNGRINLEDFKRIFKHLGR